MGMVPQLLREKFSFIAVIPSRSNDIDLSEIPFFPVIIFLHRVPVPAVTILIREINRIHRML